MRGIGAGQRIFELLDREPAIPPSTGITVPTDRVRTVRFERVGFEYPSRRGVEVLKDFNLEVTPGESVALVGMSGSGKSSVNALLMRYYDPIRGRITFGDQGM
jgi:ABC-type multidrug transport system fused ATPase/permease subunit